MMSPAYRDNFRVVEYSVSGNGAHSTRTYRANLSQGKAQALAVKLNRAQDLPNEEGVILSYTAEPMS